MRKLTHITIFFLLFSSCGVVVVTTTAQRKGSQRTTRRAGGTGESQYTLLQLRQELERREAAQALPDVTPTPTPKEQSSGERMARLMSGLEMIGEPTLHEFSVKDLLSKLLFDTQSIYGPDSRKDYVDIRQVLNEHNRVRIVAQTGYRIDEDAVLNNVNSVVALMKEERLSDIGGGRTRIQPLDAYGTLQNLCSKERYRLQPVAAHCTGFLVAPNIVATASHCLRDVPLADTRFVFGYIMGSSGATLTIKNSEIYRGERIIKAVPDLTASVLGPDKSDWALVELDRRVPVSQHRAVNLRTNGQVTLGDPLYVVGFPDGIPLKYADGALVRDNSAGAYFVSNLDTFHGNSGSPVFNAKTNLLEGILVRGEDDYEDAVDPSGRACKKTKMCSMDGCRGEDCTRVSEFIKDINQSIASLTRHRN